jgi:hypothetical protein
MSRLDEIRRRRLREVWRADAPSDFEVAMAVQRFEARRRNGRGLGRAALGWALVGALAGLAATSLASGPRAPALGIRPEPLAEPTVQVALPEPAPPRSPVASAAEPAPRERPRPVPRPALPRAAPAVRETPPATETPKDVRRDRDDLARAELWLAVGRGQDAEPILAGLEQHGATDAIRRRARELSGENATGSREVGKDFLVGPPR